MLPVDAATAQAATELPEHHSDPIDRIVIAATMLRNAAVASRDGKFRHYAVDVLPC